MVVHVTSSSCCSVHRLLDCLSRKWAMHIIRHLSENKTMRFTDIRQALPEINSRILSQRLDDLEQDGLLTRAVQHTKPITVEYTITTKGKDLKKAFDVFCTWAEKWGTDDEVVGEKKKLVRRAER
jgi:DNA-binding HxlR family transcriptional regulator